MTRLYAQKFGLFGKTISKVLNLQRMKMMIPTIRQRTPRDAFIFLNIAYLALVAVVGAQSMAQFKKP